MECKQKEFCRLTGLTRKSLLIYETKGIISPSHIDNKTNYRFYGDNELLIGSRIALLRSLGATIEVIKDVVNLSEGTFNKLLKMQSEIQTKYQQVTHINSLFNEEGGVKSIIDSSVHREKKIFSKLFSMEGVGTTRDVTIHLDLLRKKLHQTTLIAVGVPFTWYFADSKEGELHFRVSFSIIGEWAGFIEGVSIHYELDRTVYTLRHFGSYELLPLSYKRLNREIKPLKMKFTGEYIERYITMAIKSTIQDTTTLITDIGAILC